MKHAIVFLEACLAESKHVWRNRSMSSGAGGSWGKMLTVGESFESS